MSPLARQLLFSIMLLVAGMSGCSGAGDHLPTTEISAGGGASSSDSGSPGPAAREAGADAADPGADVTDDPGPVASAIQIDPAHTGAIDDPALGRMIARAWNVELGGATSYPLIARSRVYVVVSGGPRAGLVALDRASGTKVWGPVDVGAEGTAFDFAGHAYEAGRLFVLNQGGTLQAFDSTSGAPLWWTQLPDQWFFSSPPTAYRGVVYVGGAGDGGTLYAVAETSGALLWKRQVMNGDTSAPAVSDDGVFVSYSCVQAYAFSRLGGDLLWHHDGPCEGGGGATPVLVGGKLWARDSLQGSLVLDAVTGAVAGSFTASPPPAFHGLLGFFVSGESLRAEDSVTRASVWEIPVEAKGVVTAPLVVGGRVFVGSIGGVLRGFDEATGSVAFSDDLGAEVPPLGASDWGSATSFAAAEGALVVPIGTHLVAYTTAPPPSGR